MDTRTVPAPADMPPCETAELEPPCEVCDGTGEVTDAPGRGGRAILPCMNCDAYDTHLQLLAELATEHPERI